MVGANKDSEVIRWSFVSVPLSFEDDASVGQTIQRWNSTLDSHFTSPTSTPSLKTLWKNLPSLSFFLLLLRPSPPPLHNISPMASSRRVEWMKTAKSRAKTNKLWCQWGTTVAHHNKNMLISILKILVGHRHVHTIQNPYIDFQHERPQDETECDLMIL